MQHSHCPVPGPSAFPAKPSGPRTAQRWRTLRYRSQSELRVDNHFHHIMHRTKNHRERRGSSAPKENDVSNSRYRNWLSGIGLKEELPFVIVITYHHISAAKRNTSQMLLHFMKLEVDYSLDVSWKHSPATDSIFHS